ncbi:MAG: hypothetical protein WB783_15145 [Arenicellales bacterium]
MLASKKQSSEPVGTMLWGCPFKFGEVWVPEKQEENLQLFSQGASIEAGCVAWRGSGI